MQRKKKNLPLQFSYAKKLILLKCCNTDHSYNLHVLSPPSNDLYFSMQTCNAQRLLTGVVWCGLFQYIPKCKLPCFLLWAIQITT